MHGDSMQAAHMPCMAGAWKSLPGTGSNTVSGTSCPGEMPCGGGHSLSAARNDYHSVSMHSKQIQAPLQQSLPVVIADYHSATVNAWHAGPSCRCTVSGADLVVAGGGQGCTPARPAGRGCCNSLCREHKQAGVHSCLVWVRALQSVLHLRDSSLQACTFTRLSLCVISSRSWVFVVGQGS